jgi:hypothetical protein
MRPLSAERKIRLYLKAKQEWGLEHGLVPVYSNHIAPVSDLDWRYPSTFFSKDLRDKQGRLILWSFNARRDQLFNFDDPVNEMHYWLSIFVANECMPYIVTAQDIRARMTEVAEMSSMRFNRSYATRCRKFMAVMPSTTDDVLMVFSSIWKRWSMRRKIKQWSKMSQLPWSIHMTSKSGLKKYIDKKNILSILGGQHSFDWDKDCQVFMDATIAAEKKALDHWNNVRRVYHLQQPAPPTPDAHSKGSRHSFLYKDELFMPFPGASAFLRDPAGNALTLDSFTTKG